MQQQPQVFFALPPSQSAVYQNNQPGRPMQVLQVIQIVDPASVRGLVVPPTTLPLLPREGAFWPGSSLPRRFSPVIQHVSPLSQIPSVSIPAVPRSRPTVSQCVTSLPQNASFTPRQVSVVPHSVSSVSQRSQSGSTASGSPFSSLPRKRPAQVASTHVVPSLLKSVAPATSNFSTNRSLDLLPPLKKSRVLNNSVCSLPSAFAVSSQKCRGPPPLTKTTASPKSSTSSSPTTPDDARAEVQSAPPFFTKLPDTSCSSGELPKPSQPLQRSPPPLIAGAELSEKADVPAEKSLVTSLAVMGASEGGHLHAVSSTFKNVIVPANYPKACNPSDTRIASLGSSLSLSLQSGVTSLYSAGMPPKPLSSLRDWECFKPVPLPSSTLPTSVPPRKRTRAKYTLEQKMEIVNYAKTYSIYRACKHFKLSTGTIGPWTKLDFTKLKSKVYRKKKSGRRISYSMEKESALVQWVLEQQDLHQEISIRSIMDKAMEIIGASNPGFLASRGWAQKFLRRNDLIVQRSRRHFSNKLPAILEGKISQFLEAVKGTLKSGNFSLDTIINMDEVPMFFGESLQAAESSEADFYSDSNFNSASTSPEAKKKQATVVLAATASGKMLPAMVIFKGMLPPQDVEVPDGWFVCAQRDGWMDSNLMELWCQNILFPYTNQQKSLLIMDSFGAHCGERVQDLLTNKNVSIAHIPGGCTTRLQPLSVWLDHPFNTSCCEEFSKFCHAQLAAAERGGVAEGRGLEAVKDCEIMRNLEEGVMHLSSRPELISSAFERTGCSLERSHGFSSMLRIPESHSPGVLHVSKDRVSESYDQEGHAHISHEDMPLKKVDSARLSNSSFVDSGVLSECESEGQDSLASEQDIYFSYDDDDEDVYVISTEIKSECGST